MNPSSKFASKPCHVLVTGGAGFIGSHTVDLLLTRGCRVSVIDNLSTGHRANLGECEGHPNFQFIEADITQDLTLVCERAVQRFGPIERIAHFAAQTSVALSVKDPITDIQTNLLATVRLLEYARREGVAKVVFSSSSAVYDGDASLPVNETSATRPASPYGVDKIASELFLDYYARSHGIAFTALRFMNVYGPRQDPTNSYSGAISIFLDRAIANQPIAIYGDGEQTRDFVFISDVTQAISETVLSDAGNAAVINIGTGRQVSINQLVRTILELTGSLSAVRYEPARIGDLRHSVTSIARAQEMLNFTPQVALREGLNRTLIWVRSQALARTPRGSAA